MDFRLTEFRIQLKSPKIISKSMTIYSLIIAYLFIDEIICQIYRVYFL